MTEEDLKRIEATLAVTLPLSYRQVMTAFPIPALFGNADTALWDDADAIIEQNRSLRSRTRNPWQPSFFFIGSDGSHSCHAIDLGDPSAPVWWVDHSDFAAKGSGRLAPSFEAWVMEFSSTLRSDLQRDGENPDAPAPPEQPPILPARYRFGLLFLLIAVLAFLAFRNHGR